MTGLTLTARPDADPGVVELDAAGDLDGDTAPLLRTALAEADGWDVIVALGGLGRVSSMGLAVLVGAQVRARTLGRLLVLVTADPTLLDAVRTAGLDKALVIVPDRATARALMVSRQQRMRKTAKS